MGKTQAYVATRLALASFGVPGNGKFASDSECLPGVEGHEDKIGTFNTKVMSFCMRFYYLLVTGRIEYRH